MSEDLFVLLAVAILFFGGGGTLFKRYIFNTLKVKQLFKSLRKVGLSEILQSDIIERLGKYKLSQDGPRSSDTIHKTIGLQKGSNHHRYLCDVNRIARRSSGSSEHKYYTMIVDMLPIKIEGEVRIFSKLAGITGKIIEMQRSQANVPIQEITEGLSEDFMSNFSATSKNGSHLIFSQKIQSILISHSSLFPFNQKRGPIITCLHISSEGWGIICNRVIKKDNLDQLLQIADKLSDVFSQDQNI